MDKTEQIHTDSKNQEPTETEKVLGSMPEFDQFQKEKRVELETTKEDEMLKNAETSREVHCIKTQNRIRKAAARGYDVNSFARSILGDPNYYGGGSFANTYILEHSLETLEELGADMDTIRYRLPSSIVMKNLDVFKKYNPNMDVNQLIDLDDERDAASVAENLDTLLENGADVDINELVNSLSSSSTAENLDTLEKHGAKIDIAELTAHLSPRGKARNLEALNQRGANIDAKELASKLRPHEIVESLDTLENNGAEIDINKLVSELEIYDKAAYIDSLNKHGANISITELIKTPSDLLNAVSMDSVDLKMLKDKGVPVEKMIGSLIEESGGTTLGGASLYDLDYLSELGLHVDVNKLVSDRYRHVREVIDNLDPLIENGININTLIKKFSNQNGAMSYENKSVIEDALERNGLNPDDIKSIGGLYGPYQYEPSLMDQQ